MNVTYYGQACIGVAVAGKNLLFDPFIRHNPLAKAVDVESIPADFILVSHGHLDHIADAPEIAKRTGATVIANFEVGEWLEKQGVKNVHALNHGGGHAFDFGRVQFVNAIHSSGLPDGSFGGNPGGFVVETAEGNFYHSGDTALTMDMQLIGEATPLRFAALCIGDNYTMGVADAIRAADLIRCKEILGIHYDTFPQIEIDHAAAIKQFAQAGKKLYLLPIGSSHEFNARGW
jgi:L-ascorbate metabolism protein UlaG (beta-lactamase superfamily)